MKITKISTVVVNARMRNWIFVKVETDHARFLYRLGAKPRWNGRRKVW